ncbi:MULTISPECIES: PLD nuclease N-terminal domain-containing protein [Lactobacillaceae]|uniref:PLD nuclease N-terminal domain-containing protein n=1 Tax=Lactobacillaceae TaxID=33958 RepID=UPI001457119F|nr:PLD nuclease N-terminal domain-containing protein [Lactobacillus sp. HBUAS51381]NLR10139.1 PLDc_N domain-containing protein [Lactobacillus sp. HBUAS51381]
MSIHRHHHTKPSRHTRQRMAPFVAFEVTASSVVIWDILRAKHVRRGHKLGWLLLALVQPIGPWLYFAFGQTRE